MKVYITIDVPGLGTVLSLRRKETEKSFELGDILNIHGKLFTIQNLSLTHDGMVAGVIASKVNHENPVAFGSAF